MFFVVDRSSQQSVKMHFYYDVGHSLRRAGKKYIINIIKKAPKRHKNHHYQHLRSHNNTKSECGDVIDCTLASYL